MFEQADEFKSIRKELIAVNKHISEALHKCRYSTVERDVFIKLLHKNTETIQEIDKREYYGYL